jgi:dTDP-4-amino-4,6-dideoxygalactose transaminase
MTTTPRRNALSELAINGGPKIRTEPWLERGQLGAEEKAAVDALFDEAIATGRSFSYNGPVEQAYCEEAAEFLGGGYVDAVNSGTSAVYVALRALGIEPFTEVIVGPVTDPGGIMPIPMLNCIPIIADSAPGSYNVDAQQVEKVISPLTSAILVGHIAGEPADIEGIMAVARKHGIPVVEDCAQAHGATLNGKVVGSFGDVAAISTMSGKHFITGGQGGLVYTKSEELYRAARLASDRGKPFFLPEGSTNQIASLNHNLSDLGAAIGRVQLKKLPGIVEGRRAFVARLTEGFEDMYLQSVSVPPQLPGAEPSYFWWRIRFNMENLACDRDTFCAALAAEGVLVQPTYFMPHKMDWFIHRRAFGTSGYPWASPLYKGDPDREFPCPNAEAAMDSHMLLTVHESWGGEEAADILAAFKKVETAYLK